MTKSPFTGHGERAGDLLALIHSDVCGPFTTTARETFWGYALSTAIYTLNRVPTKAVEGTPYQLWTGKCPVLSHLKIWGCEAYVKRLLTNGKLDAKSDKCFFVGYPKETRGYSFYHPIDKKVFVARNGVFLEKEFLSIATSGRKIELEQIRDDEETTAPVLEHELEEQTIVPQNAQDTQEPRRSNRLRTQPERYGFLLTFEGNDIPTLTTVKTWLSKSFSMKDLGDASYALGIRIYRDRSRKLLGLSQSTYIDKVLARFSMSESKRGSLPMAQGTSLSKTQGASTPKEVERMRNVPYASAIGSIMTKDAFLVYGGKEELSIVGYTDASFQTDRNDFKSQAGIKNPLPLFCDNNGAIAQAKEPRSHQKTKHIVRRYHIIREIIARGDVEICKIGTDDNIADPLTKALGKPKHESHTWSMGIREMLD
ncbi:unnamed protein product [Cuscuta campestris]|uniref:Reverse transcriptase Ty1/copia-type domain-containing protein n=1 Tax=Cuscuta campestris TaxID=132261 RepID=A0A484LMC7_9ASTE|nr:unnamed protein product [Cuscuta campestris]